MYLSYLSFVNSSVRKINLAFGGKCIAVAVECVGLAAELKVVLQQTSFPTMHWAERTCEPYGRSNCEIYTRHCQGFGKNRSMGKKGATFEAGVTALFVVSLLAARSRAPTALCRGGCDCWGSWPPQTSHRASAAFTMDEAEPDVRFLLIVGTRLDLSSCCCCDRGGQIVMRHV